MTEKLISEAVDKVYAEAPKSYGSGVAYALVVVAYAIAYAGTQIGHAIYSSRQHFH